MAKEQKLSKEELQSIQNIQQSNQQIIFEFGKLEITRKQIEERKRNLNETYNSLKKREEQLLSELREKYDNGRIDIDRGVFIPNEESVQDEKNEPKDVVETAFDMEGQNL